MLQFSIFNFFDPEHRKRARLAEISRKLSLSSNAAADPIELLRHVQTRKKAFDDLFRFIATDETLSALLARYSAGKADIEQLYRSLLVSGAGQWLNGHWVAASALASSATLEHLLKRYRTSWTLDDATDVAAHLLEHFEMEKSTRLGRIFETVN